MLRAAAIALGLLFAGVEAFSARVERPAPPSVSPAQSALLDPAPLVVREGGAPLMRVWFRTTIPVTAPDGAHSGPLGSRRIPEGTFVGAIELPKPFVDYRRQRLPAGLYTLRFAIQPDTGDHTDTAPNREFFLLTRTADDPTPEPLEPRKLIELSSRVNDGRHPAVLLLWPVEGSTDGARVLDKGRGVVAVQLARPAAAGSRPATVAFGITVAGSRQY